MVGISVWDVEIRVWNSVKLLWKAGRIPHVVGSLKTKADICKQNN